MIRPATLDARQDGPACSMEVGARFAAAGSPARPPARPPARLKRAKPVALL